VSLLAQVHELQAALQAAWPLVSPAASISQEQLLSGTADDLVHRLVLCIATAASMDQQQLEQQVNMQQAAVPAVVPPPQQQQQQLQVTGVAQEASAHVLQQPPQQQQHQQDQKPQEPLQRQQHTSTTTLLPPPPLPQQQQPQRQPMGDIPAGYVLKQGPVVVPGCMPPYDPVQAAAIAAAVGVDLDELPPLAPQTRGHVYDSDWLTSFTGQEKDMVLKVRGALGALGRGWHAGACLVHTSAPWLHLHWFSSFSVCGLTLHPEPCGLRVRVDWFRQR
jgi:hypothetical protein